MSTFPEVDEFATIMRLKLHLNASKGGWKDCNYTFLFGKLGEEIGEVLSFATDRQFNSFLEEVFEVRRNKQVEFSRNDFELELADAANILMMMRDNREKLEIE